MVSHILEVSQPEPTPTVMGLNQWTEHPSEGVNPRVKASNLTDSGGAQPGI